MYLNYTTALLVLAHVVTDFYFQSANMTKSKRDSMAALIGHASIFFVVGFVLLIPFISIKTVAWLFVLSVSHFVIDLAKIKLESVINNASMFPFMADQLCHILAIIALTPFLSSISLNIHFVNAWASIVKFYPFLHRMRYTVLLNYIILLICYLLIINGGSIIIKLILNKYNSLKNQTEEESIKAGGLIGKLERIIILTLLINNNYTAIGYVIAAKSVARFKKLENDKQFGEYYLVGTLLSVLVALVTWLVYKFIFRSFY